MRIAYVESATDLIKLVRLVSAEGSTLPGFSPGAHIQIELPASANVSGGNWRSYSLINFDPALDTATPAREYLVAIRREDEGRGGSLHVHRNFKAGDVVNTRPPANNFTLNPHPGSLLLGGGIGVTPIISMASELARLKFGFDFHYTGRNAGQLAFTDVLKSRFDGRLHLHADDDPATRLDIAALLKTHNPSQPIYVCGPKGMINATIEIAEGLGWAKADIHFELFTEATARDGDQPFDVELKSSGRTFTVPADKSLLQTLEENGVNMLYDCRSGYCGLCSVPVLYGEIDHRDTFLSANDYAKGDVMQACISRAKVGSHLVLDL
ncbi:PDR/VanB family oxidoreductase [Acidocella aquatica]|uniref:PDR/VanB family oxidoreductase n=1 Tax=Acidocella aquatica TaxID=1922313 RepID=UPI0024E113AD|nr:PDR/VanB family oxidoreductase [Acidocella aquatica]